MNAARKGNEEGKETNELGFTIHSDRGRFRYSLKNSARSVGRLNEVAEKRTYSDGGEEPQTYMCRGHSQKYPQPNVTFPLESIHAGSVSNSVNSERSQPSPHGSDQDTHTLIRLSLRVSSVQIHGGEGNEREDKSTEGRDTIVIWKVVNQLAIRKAEGGLWTENHTGRTLVGPEDIPVIIVSKAPAPLRPTTKGNRCRKNRGGGSRLFRHS
jgi:hypothetical protein